MRGRVEITGLREFQRALKSMDAGLPKQLRLVLNAAAGIVVDYAQAHIEVKTGRARASIKARSSQRAARVAIGGNRAPYVPWLDFGGQGHTPGRPAPRPFIREGRYVYKGLRIHNEEITAKMSAGLVELGRTAGIEIS